jgi:hypothetical protein
MWRWIQQGCFKVSPFHAAIVLVLVAFEGYFVVARPRQ